MVFTPAMIDSIKQQIKYELSSSFVLNKSKLIREVSAELSAFTDFTSSSDLNTEIRRQIETMAKNEELFSFKVARGGQSIQLITLPNTDIARSV